MIEKKLTILVIEDDVVLARVLREWMEQLGWLVEWSPSVESAQSRVSSRIYDLILADALLPDFDGLSLADVVRRRPPATRLILMTGAQDLEVAAEIFSHEASEYITKPFKLEELEHRISQLMRESADSPPGRAVAPPARPYRVFPDIIGESLPIRHVFKLIQLVASRNATVLITGESGTGKELVARAIHNASPRKSKSFVAINCGAIPENLLEDELFGHVPGAYTDARGTRLGKFELATGGTIFLDEIGSMPHSLQIKLLRVLEEKSFERLGSHLSTRVDVRVLAATNSDLRQMVRDGRFREDLFYRLNVVPIHLPPLRERREDIVLIAHHFLRQLATQYDIPLKQLDAPAIGILMQHDWPGNVRELRNAMELAFILSAEREILTANEFPNLSERAAVQSIPADVISGHINLPDEGVDLNQVVSEVEKKLINQSLQRTGGNKEQAARLLFLKRTTLVEKLRRMNPPEER